VTKVTKFPLSTVYICDRLDARTHNVLYGSTCHLCHPLVRAVTSVYSVRTLINGVLRWMELKTGLTNVAIAFPYILRALPTCFFPGRLGAEPTISDTACGSISCVSLTKWGLPSLTAKQRREACGVCVSANCGSHT
jgi:hypothetical protein